MSVFYDVTMTRPLPSLPVSAIALALGLSLSRPSTDTAGRVAALCGELRRRGVYEDMLAALEPGLAEAVRTAELADSGAAWARTGQRRR